MNYLFTSESVTEGHPDKIADQISDSVLDAIIKDDPDCRVACETLVNTGLVLIAGEISTNTYVDIPDIARKVIKEIGYNDASYGFDFKACSVLTAIDEQSKDIAIGVDTGGAGDQGMMFGYACNETKELMPLPIMASHKLAMKLSGVRKDGTLKYLRPDGKTQVTIEYNENGKPLRAHTVIISAQHDPHIKLEQLQKDVYRYVIEPVLGDLLDKKTIYHINPTGIFVIGGPPADAGLTGRKIIVDTYGGSAPHGGGCFSGKDPSKVDRSAAYAARYVAKNIVANKLADKCEVQLSYAIGVVEPISIYINTFNTGVKTNKEILTIINNNFDLTPRGIIKTLDLKNPIYKKTAAYGHFGREQFTWEKIINLK